MAARIATDWWRGAVIGLLAAGAGLGVAQLLAAMIPALSPIAAVGDAAIDHAPSGVREWAIRTFGTADKTVLLIGIAVVLTAAAAAAGVLAMRSPRAGTTVIGGAGLVGLIAAATGRSVAGSVLFDVIPTLAAVVVAILTLRALLPAVGVRVGNPGGAHAAGRGTPEAGEEDASTVDELPAFDRRRFLARATAVGAVALVGGVAGSAINRPDGSGFAVPTPTDPAGPLPAGVSLADAAGVAPFYTPNDRFYRVDTAFVIPRVDLGTWRLRIHGLVERDLILDMPQLITRRLIERDITLNCVSNEVGGPYVGNARWIGVPLADLLAEAGVLDGADAVKSTAVDGFTVGTPLAALQDGRDAMIAVAMNSDPLPIAHGFPARMLVPGLYGYVSATKWLTDIEVTRFADFTAYWTERGWAERAPVKTASRIDHPRHGAELPAGVPGTIAGVAWAQHRGVAKVEVRIDDGPWQNAELAAEDTIDTWRQWRTSWTPAGGVHEIAVRATDGSGDTQTDEIRPPLPDGATGWHTIAVYVSSSGG